MTSLLCCADVRRTVNRRRYPDPLGGINHQIASKNQELQRKDMLLSNLILLNLIMTQPAPKTPVFDSLFFAKKYISLRNAMKAKDTTGIKVLLAPNFVSTDIRGSTSGVPEMLTEIQNMKIDSTKESATEVFNIMTSGDTVMFEQHYTMSKKQQNGSKFEMRAISYDKWRCVNAECAMLSTQTKHVNIFVDGKLVKSLDASVK